MKNAFIGEIYAPGFTRVKVIFSNNLGFAD